MTAEQVAVERAMYDAGEWGKRTWFGLPIQKYPVDLMTYQEVIATTGPDMIVETGTHSGGSALFFANMLDALALIQSGPLGWVVTVDQEPKVKGLAEMARNGRIFQVQGDSADRQIVAHVRNFIGDARRVMVVLDSLHTQAHVAAELEAYAPMVTPGCYLVVEDTNINGHPVAPGWGPGPHEAVEDFLVSEAGADFVRDRSRDHFMTTNPGGWLLRL